MTVRAPAAHAAYTELVLALLDARTDPFSARFDAELGAAVDDGRLDRETARTLRWWQRESVRGGRDHLADVLPPLMAALEAAGGEAESSAAGAAEAWSSAAGNGPSPALPPPTDLAERRRRTVIASLVSAASQGVDVIPVTTDGTGRS